jgi:hypothetical protein
MRERSIGHPFLRVALPLAVFALLVCIDMPQIIVQGRFWAEEGTIFFENAWVMAPASALFTSYGGYLNLIANAATLAARWFVPLPMAPYVTIATGLVFQLCPPLLLLTARDAWLQKLPVRVAGLLLLLLVPASQEVWLQTLHCQFELLLCCAIILACDIATGWRAVLRLALLTLAPLTGVVCMTLGPLFLLRAVMDRSGARLVQTVALGVPALVQLVFFFHAVPGRGYALHGVLLLCAITIHHLALPFLGIDMANTIAAAIREALRTSHVPLIAAMLPIPVAIAVLAATLRRQAAKAGVWFVLAGAVTAVACYCGAIGGVASLLTDVRGGGRYVFVPQSLFYLTVLALTATASGWARLAGWALVIWLLGVGAYAYVYPFSVMAEGPSWRREVALWQADPKHVLHIWPVGWTMTLAPGR